MFKKKTKTSCFRMSEANLALSSVSTTMRALQVKKQAGRTVGAAMHCPWSGSIVPTETCLPPHKPLSGQ